MFLDDLSQTLVIDVLKKCVTNLVLCFEQADLTSEILVTGIPFIDPGGHLTYAATVDVRDEDC